MPRLQWGIADDLCAAGISIIRKLFLCSIGVKLELFMTYCGNIYPGHLWHNFKGPSLKTATVAYNSTLLNYYVYLIYYEYRIGDATGPRPYLLLLASLYCSKNDTWL